MHDDRAPERSGASTYNVKMTNNGSLTCSLNHGPELCVVDPAAVHRCTRNNRACRTVSHDYSSTAASLAFKPKASNAARSRDHKHGRARTPLLKTVYRQDYFSLARRLRALADILDTRRHLSAWAAGIGGLACVYSCVALVCVVATDGLSE